MQYFVSLGRGQLELAVERQPSGGYLVRDNSGRTIAVSCLAQGPGFRRLLVAGRVLEVQIAEGEVKFAQQRFSVITEGERERAAARSFGRDTSGAQQIVAPMPGRIVRISCAPGDRVQKGSAVLVIEAMKMQNELCAKAEAVVRVVHVTAGQTVERGALLIELE